MEMGSVAQGWLAYELTGSALALGWVSAGRSVARLMVSLYGGALADRVEKRRLLLWTRAAMALAVAVLTCLIASGSICLWHLVAYSVVSGVISSLMMPAQKSYLAQLVGAQSLMNAVSLSSIGMGLMGIVGASAAGFAIAWLGVESVYAAIVLLYISALFCLTRLPDLGVGDEREQASDSDHGRDCRMALGGRAGAFASQERGSANVSGSQDGRVGLEPGAPSVWADLVDGVRYLRSQPALMALVGIAFARMLVSWSYRTLMPVFADEVLSLDARGLGVLSAAPGVGSMVASLVLAALPASVKKGRLMLLSGILLGISFIAYVNMPHLVPALLFLTLTGAARNTGMVTNQTLLQVSSAPKYRGRIMAMYMMVFGMMPLGTIPAGALADAYGVPLAMTVQGVFAIVVFGGLWLLGARVRELN